MKQVNPLDAARKLAEEKAKRMVEEAAARIRPQKPVAFSFFFQTLLFNYLYFIQENI